MFVRPARGDTVDARMFYVIDGDTLPKVVLQTEELSRLAFRMWGTIFWPGRDLSNMVYMFAGHQARKPVKRAVEKWLGRSFQPVRAQRPKNLPSPGRSSKDEAQPTPRAPRPRKG